MAGNNNLEFEIHRLSSEAQSEISSESSLFDEICNELLNKYEKGDIISPAEAESLSHFLLTAGRTDLLFKFYLKCLRRQNLGAFPWGYFSIALKQNNFFISNELYEIIEEGLEDQIEKQIQEKSAYKSDLLIKEFPILQSQLVELKNKFETDKLELKTKLMEQLNHNRLYQLIDKEEQTLKQLIHLFPQDIEVQLLHQAQLEKKADEILSRVKNPRLSFDYSSKRMSLDETEESKTFLLELKKHIEILAHRLRNESPEQIYNLALLAMHFELYDFSYQLLNLGPKNFASEWLKAEMLLESGRHLDLLKLIESLEKNFTENVDSTHGAIYFKAQAYFGLGQKEIAIRLLESLSDVAPHYRSTQALLHEWKSL